MLSFCFNFDFVFGCEFDLILFDLFPFLFQFLFSIFIFADIVALQRLLEQKKAVFTTTDVSLERADLERMWAQAGGKKDLPQLHIDGKFVGTYDEMQEKEEIGEFEELVSQ